MKNLVALFFFSLFTFSFMAESGIFIPSNKSKMEVNEDIDLEKDNKDAEYKYTSPSNYSTIHDFSERVKPKMALVTNLYHISYEVEVRPPRV